MLDLKKETILTVEFQICQNLLNYWKSGMSVNFKCNKTVADKYQKILTKFQWLPTKSDIMKFSDRLSIANSTNFEEIPEKHTIP